MSQAQPGAPGVPGVPGVPGALEVPGGAQKFRGDKPHLWSTSHTPRAPAWPFCEPESNYKFHHKFTIKISKKCKNLPKNLPRNQQKIAQSKPVEFKPRDKLNPGLAKILQKSFKILQNPSNSFKAKPRFSQNPFAFTFTF